MIGGGGGGAFARIFSESFAGVIAQDMHYSSTTIRVPGSDPRCRFS